VRIIEDKFILNREFICGTSIRSGQRRLLGRIDRIRGEEYCEMGYYSARKYHKLYKLECLIYHRLPISKEDMRNIEVGKSYY
jgi:hypothetical protein